MKVVAVVQARTGSKRLPGKVLADIAGAPMLARVVERAAAAKLVDAVVIATSDRPSDDSVEALASGIRVACHRGSETDVLGRTLGAATATGADLVVRLTGDCPLVDPEVIDLVVAAASSTAARCDYASNVMRRTFPKGLDAEALHVDVLARIDRLATSPEAREHVTWFAYRERPELFVLSSVEGSEDFSELDWSVDDAAGLKRVRALYEQHQLDAQGLPWRRLVDAIGLRLGDRGDPGDHIP